MSTVLPEYKLNYHATIIAELSISSFVFSNETAVCATEISFQLLNESVQEDIAPHEIIQL